VGFAGHAAGVVGQHVNPRVLRTDLVRQGSHLGQVGKIGHEIIRAYFLGHGNGLALRAAHHDNVFAISAQPTRGRRAKAVTGTGNDNRL